MPDVIVETGDSLKSIARRVYQNEDLWREVGDTLGRSVFDPLLTGEKITLPDKKELLGIAEKYTKIAFEDELKKRFPKLDLSKIKGIVDDDPIRLIEWIL
jgi:hypothetical protein